MDGNVCERDILEAVTQTREYWTTDARGDTKDHLHFGDVEIEEWYCPNCCEFFDTWGEALGHLPTAKTSDNASENVGVAA